MPMDDETVNKPDVGSSRNVILFKSESETDGSMDPYVLQLSKISLFATVIPVISFEYYNLTSLKEKLDSFQFYSGIIFSSARCVEAVKQCGPLSPGWKELKNYSVGKKTSSLAEKLLGLVTSGDNCGDAASLAVFIAQEHPGKLPLLIPHGNLSLETLASSLKERSIATDCVEVYRTLPNPNMANLISSYSKQYTPDYVVYFSPSGVNNTIDLLNQYFPNLEHTKFVAIGPTTEQHLIKKGARVLCRAEKPTPEHLALAIRNASARVLSSLIALT